MAVAVRAAQSSDLPRLLELMTEFYGEATMPLDLNRVAVALSQLLQDERLGRVWSLECDERQVGYAVLTLGFSMEYGGLDAFVDDLFVQASYRHLGLGAAALAAICEACRALGVRALHLEVERENDVAQQLYRKAGFQENGRMLLTLRLASPLHVMDGVAPVAQPIAEQS